MKSILTLVFLFLASLPLLPAQETKKMAAGATAGLHYTWPVFTGAFGIQDEPFQGAHGGVKFQYMSRPMLGFETALLFTKVGWQESISSQTYTREIDAIEWQLITHFSLGQGWLKGIMDAGPYLRFFLNNVSMGPESLPQYSMDLDNEFQYGILTGGGFSVTVGKIILQLTGQFHLGLTNFFDSDFDVFFTSSDRTGGFSASILIPFGDIVN